MHKKQKTLSHSEMNTSSFTANERELYNKFVSKAKFKTPEDEKEYALTKCKTCTKCHHEKNLMEFNGNTSGSDPFDRDGYRLRRPECRECTKDAAQGKLEAVRLAKSLGVPFKAPPDAVCAVCKSPGRRGNQLVFDHCHQTNTFRGYACNSCNRSLGVLGDNVEGLVNALNYLLINNKKKIIQDQESGFIHIQE